MRFSILSVFVCLSCYQIAAADDWPQWFGPQRDGIWREEGIVDSFPNDGLTVKWRAEVAGGYSGPVVSNGRVFVTDYVRESGDTTNSPDQRRQLQGTERVHCLSADSGEVLWTHSYNCAYNISYPAGPRASPTVEEDRVYTLGAEGDLRCLNVADGAVIWAKSLKKEYDVAAPLWGYSAHPLIDGPRLVCIVGGEGSVAVAFDKLTSKELWRSLTASEPGYAPPTIIDAAGKRQLLIWDADNLNSLDPETGNVYWSLPMKPDYGMSIMAPRKVGDLLFVSAIGNLAAVVKLDQDKPAAEMIWKADNPKSSVFCANSTPFVEDGMVYGTDCRVGSLIGADLKTGERVWTTFAPTTGSRRAGHGSAFLVKHKQKFFIFGEQGDLILAKLSRAGYDELGRFHVLDPTAEAFGRDVVWSYPAFANRCVFARNDKELVCVSLEK